MSDEEFGGRGMASSDDDDFGADGEDIDIIEEAP